MFSKDSLGVREFQKSYMILWIFDFKNILQIMTIGTDEERKVPGNCVNLCLFGQDFCSSVVRNMRPGEVPHSQRRGANCGFNPGTGRQGCHHPLDATPSQLDFRQHRHLQAPFLKSKPVS